MTNLAGNIIYSDNGVEIDFLFDNSIIATIRYSIYWNIDGDFSIVKSDSQITRNPKILLSFNKPYDLSLIADIDETNGNKPPKIIYSSADMVNKRVESLLKLKAFF